MGAPGPEKFFTSFELDEIERLAPIMTVIQLAKFFGITRRAFHKSI